MKLLVYTANYAPEPTGIGKYSGEMCAWLVKAGHEVRVVAAPPYYPQWALGAGYRAWAYKREQIEGVTVWRAPLWVPRYLSGFTRILHLLSFAASSVPLILRHAFWRPDVVLNVAPAIFCAPAGWLTARLSGARTWLHIQDFEIDAGFRLGLVKGNRIQGMAMAIERFLLRRFDRVSTISHRMVDRSSSKGVDADKLRFFPNWVNLDSIKPLHEPSSYRKLLGLPHDAIVALYSGTLGAKHGLQAIPKVARLLAHVSNLYFVISGDGVMKQCLVDSSADLKNMLFLPLQPVERLSELLGLADIHMLTQAPDVQDLVMPSKLGGMLASGRPIVATCNPITEISAVVHKRGVVVPPDDPAALAREIELLASHPEQRNLLGAAARQYAQDHLSRETVLKRFEQDLLALIGQKAASELSFIAPLAPSTGGQVDTSPQSEGRSNDALAESSSRKVRRKIR